MPHFQVDSSIDFARAISIICIVGLCHLFNYTNLLDLDWFNPVIHFMLGFFMFISGFLLGNKYRIRTKMDIVSFYKKRVVRIYPLFFISLVLMYITEQLHPWANPYFDFQHLLVSVLGLGVFQYPMTLTLWFVEIMLFYYMIFPALQSSSFIKSALSFSIVCLTFLVIHLFLFPIDISVVLFLPCFYAGVIVGKSKFSGRWKLHFLFDGKLLPLSLPLALGAYYLPSMVSVNIVVELFLTTFSRIVGGLAIIQVSTVLADKLPVSLNKIVNVISYSSMAIYMFHRPFWNLLNVRAWSDGVVKILFLFLSVPVIFYLSYHIQYLYDMIVKRYITK